MKKTFAMLSALLLCATMQAQDVKTETIDDGGSGAYKAVMASDATLATHTIFKPADLKPFGKKDKLPVLVWGNGGCANSASGHLNFLNEIASHGFVVIAIGPMPGIEGNFGRSSESKQLLEALEWITKQNADKNSQYYGKIDTEKVAAAGMSCGGLQALDVSADPRLKTIMVCNSGLFDNGGQSQAMPGMPMPAKERLQDIKVPIMYMLGGPTDIAYNNGSDDYKRITKIPAFICNLPVGHGGTYMQPKGGEYGIVATAWLKWQLKGDKEASQLFTGSPCGLSQREGWTCESKNM